MKRVFCLITVIALMLSLSITAFADNTITESGGSGTTTASYTISNSSGAGANDSYVITIPASVSISAADTEADLTVKASSAYILSGHTLKVKASSANSYTLKNSAGTSEIAYSCTLSGTQITADTEILTVAGAGWYTAAAEATATLKLKATTDAINGATASGAHTDTITFTCTCKGAAKIVTFTCKGTEYQGEEGMTLGEWKDTEYCTNSSLKNLIEAHGSSSEYWNYVITEGASYSVPLPEIS